MFKYSMLAMALLFALSGAAMAATATESPSDDSYIVQYSPDQNLGDRTQACAGNNGSVGSHQMYGTLRFDLSAYSGATINNASLQVYINDSNGTFPTPNMGIARFSGSWDEDTITWNNQPGWDDYYGPGTPVMGWWSIDVTPWTQAWVNGSHNNYGMFIYSSTSGTHDWLRWYTKEHSGSAYDPRLVLVYTETSIESASLGEIKAAFK